MDVDKILTVACAVTVLGMTGMVSHCVQQRDAEDAKIAIECVKAGNTWTIYRGCHKGAPQ